MARHRHYKVAAPQSSQAFLNAQRHSITYTLSRNQAVVVEYAPDEGSDLFQVREHFDALSFPRSLVISYKFFFQIGRSSESPIDFVVMDTVPGNRVQEKPNSQSTISR